MRTQNQLVGMIAVVGIAAGVQGQTTSIGSFGGHDYFVTDVSMSIFDARNIANGLGGYVVAINDQAEQDWLNSVVGTSERLWIGLSDEITEGTFLWDSGEAVNFTFWAPGEPNNSVGVEDWVLMNWIPTGQWNDGNSTAGGSGVRAIIEVVPSPGSLAVLAVGGVVVSRRRRKV